MQIMEFETTIDANGKVQFPNQYELLYGQRVRLLILPNTKSQENLTTATNPECEIQLKFAKEGMELYRNALQVLAT